MPVPASQRAHEVVGWYGDPDSTWSIGVESRWSDPVDPEGLGSRIQALISDHPHLGAAPVPQVVADQEWEDERRSALERPWVGEASLLRVLVATDGSRLFVAAHHGAVDGLGMVAVTGRLADRTVTSTARGRRDSTPGKRRTFLRAAPGRLLEALTSPPHRFAGTSSDQPGEFVQLRVLPRIALSSARLASAVAAAYRAWPGSSRTATPLLMLGVSTRRPGTLAVDRQTGYVRFRVDPSHRIDQLRSEFDALAPEPDFPETSLGGLAPRLVRVLRNRLGATAQVSNLGVLAAPGLEMISLFPALSGPQAVAIGVASTPHSTSLTLRTRWSDFAEAESVRLADVLVEQANRTLDQ